MWRRRLAQVAAMGVRAALSGGERALARFPAPASKLPSRSQWGDAGRRVAVYVPGRGDGYTRFNNRSGGGGGPGGPRRLSQRGQVLLVAGGGVGLVVWVSSLQEVPYTGRMHSILVAPETERQIGEQTFQQILQEAAAARTLLPQSHPAALAVRRVGSRIAAVAGDGVGGGFQDQMKGLQWEFAVIQSPEINAFVVPGGKVVVYSGLLRMVAREDELAAVLAHEIAHVLARHAAERITQGSVLELVRMVAYWGFGLPIPSGAMAAFFFLPNSRKAETEADAIGVQLAARACYDPSAAVEVFEKLGREEAKAGGGRTPGFLRTHPVSGDRVAAIRKMLPRAAILGEAAGCETPLAALQEFEDRLGGVPLVRRVDWGTVRGSVGGGGRR